MTQVAEMCIHLRHGVMDAGTHGVIHDSHLDLDGQASARPMKRDEEPANDSRSPSQNDHDVLDGPTEDEPLNRAAQQQDNDLFEVGWDDGHANPACPRTFNAREWLIVLIVSHVPVGSVGAAPQGEPTKLLTT
ncbi:hypothetical protein ACJZ2D_005433 [Fusarium nematophilum]